MRFSTYRATAPPYSSFDAILGCARVLNFECRKEGDSRTGHNKIVTITALSSTQSQRLDGGERTREHA